MRLSYGCEMELEFGAPTPVILRVKSHPSEACRLERPDAVIAGPGISLEPFRDAFGNAALRTVAPAGRFMVRASGLAHDDGAPDPQAPEAAQVPVEALPTAVLPFLLGSRYVETDRLSNEAWARFGDVPAGWARAQAVNDFVHDYISFGYEHARDTRSAEETFEERRGVCRDMAHLALAFFRALNMPARYCTGYVSDVGVEPPPDLPMDFSAWTEVWLAGAWHVFDPRNHVPRIGRLLVAVGRDAADAPMIHSFGAHGLTGFRVWAEPLDAAARPVEAAA